MPSKIIKKQCPFCDSIAVEKSITELGDLKFILLECGHTVTEDKLTAHANYELISSDGRKLRPFQVDGIQFAEQSSVRCLIADEMGLGKTVQALGLLKLHPELCPALIIVKSSLKIQWFGEVIRWCGAENYLPQVIPNGKVPFVPGFPVYIISYDLLRRLSPEVKQSINFKTVIIDECQQIKNHLSARAKEVQGICKDVEHIICLSGTPIKNNAGEYFTVLNLLKPRRFPYYADYIRRYCDAYDNGWGYKVGGLKNAEAFHQDTEDFIIRRTREEVAPELPKVSRNFQHVELAKAYQKVYEQAQDELEEEYFKQQQDDEDGMISAIQKMTKLRHICGFNKVDPTVEFVEEFLLDTNRKIVIFTHHLDVTALLKTKLQQMIESNNLNVVIEEISAAQGSDQRNESVMRMRDNPSSRVCLASTLAAGEGLNMQFMSDCILMERQWNPANEEQVEGRFIRIGQEADKVSATYMIASGTIDEFFTELVEQKRAIVASTLDNKEIAWNESSLMKELLEIVVRKGGKRWKL